MTQKTRKILIRIGAIVGILVILLGGLAIYFAAKWKPLLTEKIKNGVDEASAHLYQIDFKDIHLNILTGSAVLDSISLMPDTNVYQQLKAVKRAPSHLYKVRLAHLKLSRVGILTAYFKKKIDMNTILLDNPSIDVIYTKVPKRIDSVKKNQSLYQLIAKSLRSIHVKNIKIADADIDYYSGAKKINSIKHLTVNVKEFLVDSAAQFDTTRVLHAKDIGFEMSGYRSLTEDKMYTIKVDTVRGSLSKRTMNVSGLQLLPMYKDLTFSRMYKTQKDRYDLAFSTIELKGVDFLRLNDDGELHIKKVDIGPAKVAVFLNRALPPPNFDKGRNYPHNALKRLPIPTHVDTISLNKIDIAYTEYEPKSKERGTLNLENLGGTILNITNDSARLAQQNHAYANLYTNLMGVGKMNVKIDFNLTGKNAPFSYVGEIGSFNMRVLNPLSKPLGSIAIETGYVQSASFVVNANEFGSNGTVKILYNNLKVNMLKDGDNGEKEKKGLLSFLANTILIRNDNPTKGEVPRVAQVKFERVPQASFFNLMWKSVFVGIREIVGIGIVPMKAMPETKSSKKELREKRRAERKKEKAKQ